MRDRTEIRPRLFLLSRTTLPASRAPRSTPSTSTTPPRQARRPRAPVLRRKKKTARSLFIDGEGYDITFRGARPLPDALLERYRESTRHNFFYILRMRLKEPGLIVEFTGQDVIENQSVDILDIYRRPERKRHVYVNSITKLPVASVSTAATRSPKTASKKSPASPNTSAPATACSGRSTCSASATPKS